MKKIFSAVATLAILLFAGCTQDLSQDQNINVPAEGSTLTIGLADGRTYLGDLDEETGARKVYWSAGDQVAANGEASTEIVINEENKANANFTFGTTVTYPAKVLYPAEMYKDASTITVPALQARATGSFGVDAAPMAAVADGNSVPMLQHLMGVLRLRLVAGDEAHNEIIKVSVKGNAGEQMSGDFAIDYANGVLTSTGSTAAEDLVASVKVNKTLSEAVTDVFVVIPAREYAQGLTITIHDAQGHFMTQSTTAGQSVVVSEGKIYALPQLAFNPTGTSFDIEISSAADLVAFAKDYNEGKYEGLVWTVIGLTQDIVFDDATNAEWVAIGGKFNGVNNYFEGNFNGNNFSIKNWTATQPLFGYTSSSSLISNLTIDASCTIEATPENSPEGHFGALVAYHKGLIKNCHNNADVTITGSWTVSPRIGGVVGRIAGGDIEGCTMNGDVQDDATFVTTSHPYIGGILGTATSTTGDVKKSTMYGDITISNAVKSTSVSYYVGGVAGMFRGGSMTGCANGSADVTPTMTITTTTEGFKQAYVGGIVGMLDNTEDGVDVLNGCTNYATVKFGVNNSMISDGVVALGGIVGQAKNSLDGCTNYGKVHAYAANATALCHHMHIGGIVGHSIRNDYSPDSIVIDEAENNGTIMLTGHKDGPTIKHYWVTVGGILGLDAGTTCTYVTNSTNNGFVGVSFAASSRCDGRGSSIGGIVGLLYRGGSKIESCTNNGYVCNYNYNNTNTGAVTNNGAGIAGGIAGYAGGVDGTPLTITECHSNCIAGPATHPSEMFGGSSTTFGIYGYRGLNGGLVGFASYTNITDCTSKCEVYQHQNGYLGGAVGLLQDSTLSGCTITSQDVRIKNANTVGAGGLVGATKNACTISNNIFNGNIAGTACTAYGVLLGVVDAGTTTGTGNKVKGKLLNAAITLDSTMVGTATGTNNITGTTLYE